MVNGDPYRSTPQPAERRVINRSGAAYRAADEPQPVKEEPPKAPVRAASSSRAERFESDKRGSRWPLWTVIIILIIAIIGVGSYFLLNNTKKADTGIDTSRYQAIFLVNGQIYFGKLSDFNDASFKLVDIYYPQAQKAADDATTGTQATDTSGGIQLIKLGDEVHGPENEMFISKDQILYYENLKADSRVSELIKQNQ